GDQRVEEDGGVPRVICLRADLPLPAVRTALFRRPGRMRRCPRPESGPELVHPHSSGYSARPMILENGVVRTMDSTLPLARALAIAGNRIAGGVGTHETALPSPDVVDLGGRAALPGFTDSHVHFPTWSLAQRDVRLDGVASVAEAV